MSPSQAQRHSAELMQRDVKLAQQRREIERLQAALDNRSRSDGVLLAIILTLNGAGIKDYEGNPITEINVLQGVRRLIEHANG